MNPADPFLFVINWFLAPLMKVMEYFQTGHPFLGLLMLVLAVLLYAILYFGIRGLINYVRSRPRRSRRASRRY